MIPYGRAINPITGTNWEAAGVKPDIAVNADSALTEAVLSFYDYQMTHLQDSAQQRKIVWARDMLDAAVHTLLIDTAVLQTYTGRYGNRIIMLEKGILQYIGSNGKKYALLPMNRNTFKISGMDDVKVQFKNNVMLFVFEDGFVRAYERGT